MHALIKTTRWLFSEWNLKNENFGRRMCLRHSPFATLATWAPITERGAKTFTRRHFSDRCIKNWKPNRNVVFRFTLLLQWLQWAPHLSILLNKLWRKSVDLSVVHWMNVVAPWEVTRINALSWLFSTSLKCLNSWIKYLHERQPLNDICRTVAWFASY